jgi:hypothetical protein
MFLEAARTSERILNLFAGKRAAEESLRSLNGR